MEKDVKFTLWTRETDIGAYDLKSKGVKGKYIDAVSSSYSDVLWQISSSPSY